MQIAKRSALMFPVISLALMMGACGDKTGFSSNSTKSSLPPSKVSHPTPDGDASPKTTEKEHMLPIKVEAKKPEIFAPAVEEIKDFIPTAKLVKAGESTQITVESKNIQSPKFTYKIDVPSGVSGADILGKVSASGLYTAPKSLPNALNKVTVLVTLDDGSMLTKKLEILVIPYAGFATIDDGKTQGAVGNLYDLNPVRSTISRIPNWSLFTPVSKVIMANFAVPARPFDLGFPGVSANLKEYFGIAFKGKIVIPASGKYKFMLASDDGSNFYIDDKLVVGNDFDHSYISKFGDVELTAGEHPYKLDYYQGPATYLGLTLEWTPPGGTSFVVVPVGSFLRE